MPGKNTFVSLIKQAMIDREWVNRNGRLINKKLADASKVNAGTISRFLNGKSVNMKLDNLYQMLSALDLIKDGTNGSRPEEAGLEKAGALDLSRVYRDADEETREMIDDLLTVMQHGNTDMKNAVRMGLKGVMTAIDKEAVAHEQETVIRELEEKYQAIIKRLDLLTGPSGSKEFHRLES